MTPFRFRLARILDWYGKQCRIEENRLHVCRNLVAQAQGALERHREEVIAHQMELIRSPRIEGLELASMSAYRGRAKERENKLLENCRECERSLARQYTVTQAAQRRLRLVEKLRERGLTEHTYKADRELEQLASESHLASFTRTLHNNSQ